MFFLTVPHWAVYTLVLYLHVCTLILIDIDIDIDIPRNYEHLALNKGQIYIDVQLHGLHH